MNVSNLPAHVVGVKTGPSPQGLELRLTVEFGADPEDPLYAELLRHVPEIRALAGIRMPQQEAPPAADGKKKRGRKPKGKLPVSDLVLGGTRFGVGSHRVRLWTLPVSSRAPSAEAALALDAALLGPKTTVRLGGILPMVRVEMRERLADLSEVECPGLSALYKTDVWLDVEPHQVGLDEVTPTTRKKADKGAVQADLFGTSGTPAEGAEDGARPPKKATPAEARAAAPERHDPPTDREAIAAWNDTSDLARRVLMHPNAQLDVYNVCETRGMDLWDDLADQGAPDAEDGPFLVYGAYGARTGWWVLGRVTFDDTGETAWWALPMDGAPAVVEEGAQREESEATPPSAAKNGNGKMPALPDGLPFDPTTMTRDMLEHRIAGMSDEDLQTASESLTGFAWHSSRSNTESIVFGRLRLHSGPEPVAPPFEPHNLPSLRQLTGAAPDDAGLDAFDRFLAALSLEGLRAQWKALSGAPAKARAKAPALQKAIRDIVRGNGQAPADVQEEQAAGDGLL